MASPARQRGFTLLELIIVIFLIALSTAFISTRLSHDLGRDVEQAAKQFAALVNYCKEEAVVTSEPVAVYIDPDEARYVFLRLGDADWEEIANDNTLRPRTVKKPVDLKIIKLAQNTFSRTASSGKSNPKNKKKKKHPYKNAPLIVADSLGRLTPFEVAFFFEDAEFRVRLGDDGRALVTKRSDDDDG